MILKASDTEIGENLLSVMMESLTILDVETPEEGSKAWMGDFFVSLLLQEQTITAWNAGMEVYGGMSQLAMTLDSIKDLSFEGFQKHLVEFVDWQDPAVLRFGYSNLRLSLLLRGYDWHDATKYCMECGQARYMMVGTESGNGVAWCQEHIPHSAIRREFDIDSMPMTWAFYKIEGSRNSETTGSH